MKMHTTRALRPHGAARPAFTLVELLVAIFIIVVLISVLLPSLSRANEQSRRLTCLSNLRSLAQTMVMYANDSRDHLPNGNWPGDADPNHGDQVLVSMAEVYSLPPAVFHCPSDADPTPRAITNNYLLTPNSARVSYDFYSISWMPQDGPLLTRLKGQAPLAWDLGVSATPNSMQNHGTTGGNVVFADSHAEWQLTALWERIDWPSPAGAFYP